MVNLVLKLLILGLVIGLNNLMVALSLGALGMKKRHTHILIVFGLFEFFIPLVGVWLGQKASGMVATHAFWLGPTVLAALGVMSLRSAGKPPRDQKKLLHAISSTQGLVFLAASLSSDNLMVGFSLGLGGIDPLTLALTIMFCSVTMTWIGLNLGGKMHSEFETASEIFTGFFLIALAMAMLAGWI
jgi:putative Mn2+ efflux pump MntP